MVKRLDLMLVKGFIGPFAVSFFIALFVLVMQTLWLYIDDIIGKGAGIFVIIEFLSYLSLSLVPMALPIGVLLAGVFLFGNLGERYELSSIKSAGVSLVRIMLPIMLLCTSIGLVSWFFSDYVIPKSNLKFLSRLHDLKRQKPTLSLEEGVFNEDFYGYVIRIEKKISNGKTIQNILIDDHSNTSTKATILARSGEMYVTPGGKFLVMQLENGEIYQVPDRATVSNSLYPFVRTKFKELTKVFPLEEFELERSDEDLFKSNQRMKNSKQLRSELDSLSKQRANLYHPIFSRFIEQTKEDRGKAINDVKLKGIQRSPESKLLKDFKADYNKLYTANFKIDSLLLKYHNSDRESSFTAYQRAKQNLDRELNNKRSFEESEKNLRKKKSKFAYELYIKYSFALVCLLFVFVGAPLGAIVRKGGYGYPLIICILVFIVYILLNTFCKRLSEGLTLGALTAAWIPCAVILIPGILLTWSAQNDANPVILIKNIFKK